MLILMTTGTIGESVSKERKWLVDYSHMYMYISLSANVLDNDILHTKGYQRHAL